MLPLGVPHRFTGFRLWQICSTGWQSECHNDGPLAYGPALPWGVRHKIIHAPEQAEPCSLNIKRIIPIWFSLKTGGSGADSEANQKSSPPEWEGQSKMSQIGGRKQLQVLICWWTLRLRSFCIVFEWSHSRGEETVKVINILENIRKERRNIQVTLKYIWFDS